MGLVHPANPAEPITPTKSTHAAANTELRQTLRSIEIMQSLMRILKVCSVTFSASSKVGMAADNLQSHQSSAKGVHHEMGR